MGTGKTYLTATVVDQIQEMFESSTEDGGLAFFYCDKLDPDRRTALAVLRSFVRQLSTTYRTQEEMRPELRSECVKNKRKGARFNVADCTKLLVGAINFYPRTTLILDALDECDKSTRAQLMKAISAILKSKNPVKVFITSRADGNIKDEYQNGPKLSVDESVNADDIKAYISGTTADFKQWKDVTQGSKHTVSDTLAARGAGMFRWVQLQLLQLSKRTNDTDVLDRLGKLPEGIEESYDEIYKDIMTRGEVDVAHVQRAFKWVMCAATPMSSEELLAAICLPADVAGKVDNKVSESILLDLCENLLIVDPKLKVWKFSHLSVVEYIEKRHWTGAGAHCYAAKVCLSQLLTTFAYTEEEGASVKSNANAGAKDGSVHSSQSDVHEFCRRKHPIRKYVQLRCYAHVRTQENQAADPDLIRLLKTFLKHPMESSEQYRQ